MNVLTSHMDQEASRWGVKIQFVKIQNVDMPSDLREVLSAKKDADLRNQEVRAIYFSFVSVPYSVFR